MKLPFWQPDRTDCLTDSCCLAACESGLPPAAGQVPTDRRQLLSSKSGSCCCDGELKEEKTIDERRSF